MMYLVWSFLVMGTISMFLIALLLFIIFVGVVADIFIKGDEDGKR